MILVENPSFGLPSSASSSSSTSSSTVTSNSSSSSSTPAPFHNHHQTSSSSGTDTKFAFDLYANDHTKNLLLEDIEQLLSKESNNQQQNNHIEELEKILQNPSDLFYSELSEYDFYYNKNKNQDDEDLKFLELDLLSDNSSPGVSDQDPGFDQLTNFDDINLLTPSVQRLFSSQISMSEYTGDSSNNNLLDSDQNIKTSLLNNNNNNNNNSNNPQQQANSVVYSHQISQNSISASNHSRPRHPHPLIRQDSQILFGSCCSSNTNTTFDSVSNYGSGGSSTSSSTPSTPSSIIGVSVPTQQQSITLQQSSSLISTNSVGSLPSFNEIYSPPRFPNPNQLIINNQQQQQQRQNELNFDYINSTVADYFKFEDYISESESDIENNYKNNIIIEKSTIASETETVPSTQIRIKEESMDINDDQFHQTSISSNINNNNSNNTSGCLQFNLQHQSTSKTGPTTMVPASNKIEQDDQDDGIEEKIVANDFLFSPFSSSSIPSSTNKSRRIHLHNLSLNVLNPSTCLGTPPPSSSSQPYHNQSFGTTVSNEPINQQQQQQQQTGLIQLEPVLVQSLVYPALGTVTTTTATTTSSPGLARTTSGRNGHRTITSTYRSSSNSTTKNSGNKNHKSKSITMQTCAVCGDVAACQHYGVLTCEGCKGFFKRTVQKGSKYTCLGNKDCTVDKRRRNRCQFCRFQKCLAVGMVKEVVRTDSLKGRRGRLPSKPKSPHQQETMQSPPMSTIASLLKAHDETSADKANLDFSRFSENIGTQMDNQFGQELIDQQVLSLLSISLDSLMTFVEKIPGFKELNELDKKSLFQNSCLELFALRMAYRITPGTNFIILCNNIVLHRNQFMFTLGEWLPMIEELSKQLHSMNLDMNAFVCLCALTVITARNGVEDANQIEQIENKIINSLRDHTIYNNEAQKKPNYFSRILTKLSELRTIGEYGHRIIIKKICQLSSNLKPEIIALERKISPINSQQMSLMTAMNTTGTSTNENTSCDNTNQLEIDFQSIATIFKDWTDVMDNNNK